MAQRDLTLREKHNLDLRKLTDSSGGTASATDTIVAPGATYTETAIRNDLATLAKKINEIIARMRVE